MYRYLTKNKIILTISFITGMGLLLSRCVSESAGTAADVRGELYAGSLSCRQCHNTIYTNYQHTTHYRTSGPVKDELHISAAINHFIFNDSVKVAFEKRDSGLYQVQYIHGKQVLAKPFDIIFGSGKNAHSFGYWQDKKLYQLPLSYFTTIRGWANSPGFPAREAFFYRSIISRCFECHSSYIAEDVVQEESLIATRNLDKQSIIYGIDCERCHGPAANHVNFHTQNPAVKEVHYMASWKLLPYQRKLDVCAVCHSGNDVATQRPTFSFQPGDTLANYYLPTFGGGSSKEDVHGKQLQMLAASRCFQMSKNLDCTSCHHSHEDSPRNMVGSSGPCMSCHQKGAYIDCPMAASLGKTIVNNCINCHMPDEASKAISFQETGYEALHPYLLRTHRIAIYPEATRKTLDKLKGN